MKVHFALIVLSLLVLIMLGQVVKASTWFVHVNESQVSIIIGPYNASMILNYIGQARHAIYAEVYELTYQPLINELAGLASRGVNIYIVLSCNVYGGIPSDEYQAVSELLSSGVHVSFNCMYDYIHSKVFVIDNETLIIGSINPTYYGFTRDIGLDLVINNSTIATEFATIILDDYHNETVESINYQGIVVSPINSAKYLSELLSQPGTLYMAFEELYPSSGMYGLIEQHSNRFIIVNNYSEDMYAVNELGAKVLSGLTAKVIVVGDYVYVGSINLDYTSLYENRELGIILENPAIARDISSILMQWYSNSQNSVSYSSSSATYAPSITIIALLFLIILIIMTIRYSLSRGRRIARRKHVRL